MLFKTHIKRNLCHFFKITLKFYHPVDFSGRLNQYKHVCFTSFGVQQGLIFSDEYSIKI